MADLPARPSLDHLRHEARDLLRAAKSGDTAAVARVRAVSGTLTLAGAQLALAREYGFASWPRLKAEVDARTTDLARQADTFCVASIRDTTGRAVRMLAATPELAGYNFATAVTLGDADRVRAAITRDPGLVTGVDARTGWTPLHAACASNWHRLDPARADGLLAVARLLLDAGADPNGHPGARSPRSGWTPLRCAVAGAANPAITGLLLERGAVPEDHDLYLAGFGGDDHESLRLLLRHAADVTGLAEQALAAPLSLNDAEGVRLLLEAGADPRRYADDDGESASAAYEAVRSGCSAGLLDLLLAHGADPDRPGRDGRSPLALATVLGRADLAERAAPARRRRRHHRRPTGSWPPCQHADRDAVQQQLAADPGLPERLTGDSAGRGHDPGRRDRRRPGARPDARPRLPGGRPRRRQRRHRPAHRGLRGQPRRASGCCSTAGPTSRPATRPGTARRWTGPRRQRRTADRQPPPRLDRHRGRPARGRGLHRGHHALAR